MTGRIIRYLPSRNEVRQHRIAQVELAFEVRQYRNEVSQYRIAQVQVAFGPVESYGICSLKMRLGSIEMR